MYIRILVRVCEGAPVSAFTSILLEVTGELLSSNEMSFKTMIGFFLGSRKTEISRCSASQQGTTTFAVLAGRDSRARSNVSTLLKNGNLIYDLSCHRGIHVVNEGGPENWANQHSHKSTFFYGMNDVIAVASQKHQEFQKNEKIQKNLFSRKPWSDIRNVTKGFYSVDRNTLVISVKSFMEGY